MRSMCLVVENMAFGSNTEEGPSAFKFWLLFVVGLVIVLSVFRGLTGKIEVNAKEAGRNGKRQGRRMKKKEGGAKEPHEHQD